MGVAGLLPFLDKAMTRRHLKTFQGSVVAVDASIWICRAAYAIPSESAVLAYILRRVKLIQDAGCVPLLVFDGLTPKSKDAEVLRRANVLKKLLEKKKLLKDEKQEEEAVVIIKKEPQDYPEYDDDDDEVIFIEMCDDLGKDFDGTEENKKEEDQDFDLDTLNDLVDDDGEEEKELLSFSKVSSVPPLPSKEECAIDPDEQDYWISTQVQTQIAEEAQIKEIEEGDEVPDKEIPLVSSKAKRTFALKIMEKLEILGVPFIGSPAESDPQIAWLVRNGVVDIVITDDSDLIIYGCPKVSTKFMFFSFVKWKYTMCVKQQNTKISGTTLWSSTPINSPNRLSII